MQTQTGMAAVGAGDADSGPLPCRAKVLTHCAISPAPLRVLRPSLSLGSGAPQLAYGVWPVSPRVSPVSLFSPLGFRV